MAGVGEAVLEKPDEDPGLATLVSQLTADAREVARAEVALQKAKLGEIVGRYRSAALLFAAAGTLAVAAVVALELGLIVSLATLIGPWLATVAVAGGSLLLAALLALVGRSRLALRRAK